MATPKLSQSLDSNKLLEQLQVTTASNKFLTIELFRGEIKETLNVWKEVSERNPDSATFKGGVATLQGILDGFSKTAMPFQERSALRNIKLINLQTEVTRLPGSVAEKHEIIQNDLISDLRQMAKVVTLYRLQVEELSKTLSPEQKESIRLAGIRQQDPHRSLRENGMVMGEFARGIMGFLGAPGALLSGGTTLLNNALLKMTQDRHGQEASTSSTAMAGAGVMLSLSPLGKPVSLALGGSNRLKAVLTSGEALEEIFAGGKLADIVNRSVQAFISPDSLSRINAFRQLFDKLDEVKIALGTPARGMATLTKLGSFGHSAVSGAINAAKELVKDGVLTPENANRLKESLATMNRTTTTISQSTSAIGAGIEEAFKAAVNGNRSNIFWNQAAGEACEKFLGKLLSRREYMTYAENAIEHLKDPIEKLASPFTPPHIRQQIARDLLEQFNSVMAKLAN